MHAKVKEGHNEEETTRGASLRELQRFFKEHDKDEGYAGLRRIADEDGTAVWTILKETEVAAQLEKRAGERREEERRHEKIFSAQARAPSEATDATSNDAEAAEARFQTALEAARADTEMQVKAARAEAEAARSKAEAEVRAPSKPLDLSASVLATTPYLGPDKVSLVPWPFADTVWPLSLSRRRSCAPSCKTSWTRPTHLRPTMGRRNQRQDAARCPEACSLARVHAACTSTRRPQQFVSAPASVLEVDDSARVLRLI